MSSGDASTRIHAELLKSCLALLQQAQFVTPNLADPANGIPPSVFAGDFNLADLARATLNKDTIAGWIYHGGGGGGYLRGKRSKGYLVLQPPTILRPDSYVRQHNRLYIPPNVTAVAFSLRITAASPDDQLQFYIGDTPVGNPIPLGVKTKVFLPQSIQIPSQSFQNTVNTFRFQLIDRLGNGLTAKVYLDDIHFLP